jgi:hypothetical protein
VSESVERIERAATDARIRPSDSPPASSYDRALEIAVSAIQRLSDSQSELDLGEPISLELVDDDLAAARASPFAAPGSSLSTRDRLARCLEKRGLRTTADPAQSSATLVAVFSDVRGWKGRSGLGRESVQAVQSCLERDREAVVILFGHPRASEQLPSAANVLCAWSVDPLMQDAAAVYLTSARQR